jgi:hypothetical protein
MPLRSFRAATGVRPRLAVYYSGWNERFQASFAAAARASGAVPVIQVQPDDVSLASIAGGRWDPYLTAYARAVRAYGQPVIVSFGHEMNGDWYSWGNGHESPAAFVAAWRHVVATFRAAGAGNVTWLWTVSSVIEAGKSAWLGQWWPGDQWVGMVGLDGYYYRAGDTFGSVFGQTLAEVRQFTNAPAVIAEVGVGPNASRARQVTALVAGARAAGIGALVWFDIAQHDGVYHQDWRLADDPAARDAFRAAMSVSLEPG